MAKRYAGETWDAYVPTTHLQPKKYRDRPSIKNVLTCIR
jgi:hypothetical protein